MIALPRNRFWRRVIVELAAAGISTAAMLACTSVIMAVWGWQADTRSALVIDGFVWGWLSRHWRDRPDS